MEEHAGVQGGVGALRYPLVADIKREISRAYDVESEDGMAFRGSFLIDKAGMKDTARGVADYLTSHAKEL